MYHVQTPLSNSDPPASNGDKHKSNDGPLASNCNTLGSNDDPPESNGYKPKSNDDPYDLVGSNYDLLESKNKFFARNSVSIFQTTLMCLPATVIPMHVDRSPSHSLEGTEGASASNYNPPASNNGQPTSNGNLPARRLACKQHTSTCEQM